MIIELDLESETPIYEQLVNVLLEGIATKQLLPGEPLPSVRTLAADIGINMHTVNKAYKLLQNDGFLLIHRQKGVVVNLELPTIDDPYKKKMMSQLRTIVTEAISRGMSETEFQSYVTLLFKSITKRGDHK